MSLMKNSYVITTKIKTCELRPGQYYGVVYGQSEGLGTVIYVRDIPIFSVDANELNAAASHPNFTAVTAAKYSQFIAIEDPRSVRPQKVAD